MLRHVLWIGGPPGTGKTAIATRLARRHGLRWYGSDARTWQHRDRALAIGNVAAARWEAMTPQERWERSSPAEIFEMSLHVVRGPMIIDDLRALPRSPLVVAEGSALPARAVSTGVADHARAVWLIPTRHFQRAQLRERGIEAGPLALYELLAETIAEEAREHDVPVLMIDGLHGIDDTVTAVEERFAAALAAGPRAETLVARRALIREANDAIADQVRGYYARPWADGEADAVVREFLCECGNPRRVRKLDLPANGPDRDRGPNSRTLRRERC